MINIVTYPCSTGYPFSMGYPFFIAIIDKCLAQKTGAATSQDVVARKILFVLND